MRRIEKNKIIDISPVRIYWDDVEYIETIFNENELKINKIESDNYEYDSLKELKTHVNVEFINNLSIDAFDCNNHDKYIKITINPGLVNIYAGSLSSGVRAELKEFFIEKSPWYSYSLRHPVWQIISGTLPVAAAMVCNCYLYFQTNNYFLCGVVGGILFLLFMWFIFKENPLIGATKIFVKYRNEKQTFLQKNHSALIQMVLQIVAGLIVGIVIGKVF